VHETIKEALSRYRLSGERLTLQELQDAAVARMRGDWREALDKAWLTSPKKTNIFELYYGDGENYGECRRLPREVTDAAKSRVLDCMEGFFFSPVVREFLQLPPENWMSIDTLDSFQMDEIKIWCALDFAFRDAEGCFRILDWKTGAEHRATIAQQLACYALFAMRKWNVPLEKLRIQGVFLKDGGRVQSYELHEETIENARRQIRDSYAAMKAKLSNAEENLADKENFPRHLLESRCAACAFRRICLLE